MKARLKVLTMLAGPSCLAEAVQHADTQPCRRQQLA